MNGSVAFFYNFTVEKLPYITIVVFLIGLLIRTTRWISGSKNSNGPPFSFLAAIKYVFLDIILFRKTFKTDRISWSILFLFHIAAGGIIFGHLRGFNIWSADLFAPLGEGMAEFMIELLPIYMGWIFIATQVLLIIRRGILEDRQLMSFPDDYLVLILLLVKSILGQGMRIFPPEAIPAHTYNVIFIPGIIVLHLEKVPSFHWFFLHIFFTQLFVMYIPYSKLIHVISGVISTAIYGSRRAKYGI